MVGLGHQLRILYLICGLALLLAIPSIWPYSYYELLRWFVCGAALFLAYSDVSLKKSGAVWFLIAIAVLFNPIAPVFLSKQTWVFLDAAAGAGFIYLSSRQRGV